MHVLLAVVYTTPWDNYLVATGVWYYDPQLVSGIVLGWVPIEEYTFFVLQTILTSLVLLFVARRWHGPRGRPAPNQLAFAASAVKLRCVVISAGWRALGWLNRDIRLRVGSKASTSG